MCFVKEVTFVLFVIAFCSCSLPKSFNKEDKLDHFIVTWVPPGSKNPYGFVHMPREAEEATQRGCKNLDNGCENPELHYLGSRYVCNDSVDALPIYDKNGYVAGIQMAISKEIADQVTSMHYANYYSTREETIMGGQYYVVTVYFIAPGRICSGRSKIEFENEGTVTKVYIQNGTDPIKDASMIPINGDNRTLYNMNWIEGKCVATMGLHYYHGLTANMSCSDFYTNFLIYDETSPTRRMTGIGFMMLGNYTEKPRFEFVPVDRLGIFVKRVPDCLPGAWKQARGLSSFHVYFVKDPSKITCNNQTSNGAANMY